MEVWGNALRGVATRGMDATSLFITAHRGAAKGRVMLLYIRKAVYN